MRRSRKPIVIASRRSALARTQAGLVGKALARLHPTLSIEYRYIDSDADRIAGSLASHGGKALFARAIEQALLRHEADIAVHSLKDLPADDQENDPRLTLAAIPQRTDPRDCLIARDGVQTLDGLPQGAVFGTSSPRRAAQVLRARPDLQVRLMRGNVDTRVRAITEAPARDYDATLLAAAGLKRLKLKQWAGRVIEPEIILPAACQGALAIQCRADDHVSLTRCLPLNDATTSTAVHAERQVVAALGADCHSAVAVHAAPVDPREVNASRNADSHWFSLHVRVLSGDGVRMIEARERTKTAELRRLVKRIAEQLKAQGADALLADARHQTPLPDPTPRPAGQALARQHAEA